MVIKFFVCRSFELEKRLQLQATAAVYRVDCLVVVHSRTLSKGLNDLTDLVPIQSAIGLKLVIKIYLQGIAPSAKCGCSAGPHTLP